MDLRLDRHVEGRLEAEMDRRWPGHTGGTFVAFGMTPGRGVAVLFYGDWLVDEDVFIPPEQMFPAARRAARDGRKWRHGKAPVYHELVPREVGPKLRVTLGEVLRARR